MSDSSPASSYRQALLNALAKHAAELEHLKYNYVKHALENSKEFISISPESQEVTNEIRRRAALQFVISVLNIPNISDLSDEEQIVAIAQAIMHALH